MFQGWFSPFDTILGSNICLAFRAKIRHDIAQNNTADPEAYQKHNQFIRDVAQVLRKNVVQGVHIPGKAQEDGASLYRKYRATTNLLSLTSTH